jgi:hypothetical protein
MKFQQILNDYLLNEWIDLHSDSDLNTLLEHVSGGIKVKKVLNVKSYDYNVNTEIWSLQGTPDTEIKAAYTKNGKYLGDPKTGKFLTEKYGIQEFDLSAPDHTICTIGFNPNTNIWYGWSHRAIFGFKIG